MLDEPTYSFSTVLWIVGGQIINGDNRITNCSICERGILIHVDVVTPPLPRVDLYLALQSAGTPWDIAPKTEMRDQ